MSGIIGGIEGGATHSHVILVDQKGQILAALEGPGTNHHLIGIEECQRLINEMVDEAKAKANLPLEEPLLALGLSLSGCEREESNQEIIKGLEQNYPNLSKQYAIGSDTDGSVAATSDKGGVVCISGTGSNTLLINPDGSRAQCGGWGYLLGDEGSAWKMVYMAIKMCFEDLDKYEPAPHPINNVWKSAMQFFGCSSQADFLDKFYRDFNKAKLASFCRILANLADDGDKLSQYIFFQAGQQIARSLSAVILKASPKLLNREGGLQVSCVGSVWLSWHLLKRGFVAWIDKHSEVKELSLIKVVSASGLGAAYMAWYGVSMRAIKICFDALDNFRPPPYPIEKVWQKVQDYFSIESQADLFQHISMNFDKNMIGNFCMELVGLAHEGIELAQFIFYELGAILARQIAAVFPKVAPELMNQPGGGLLVVCVGSVWLSWGLMKPGFEYWMDQNQDDKEFVLGNLVCEHALGTTYFACDKLGIDLRRTYDKNIAVFYHYTLKDRAKCPCPHDKPIQEESEW